MSSPPPSRASLGFGALLLVIGTFGIAFHAALVKTLHEQPLLLLMEARWVVICLVSTLILVWMAAHGEKPSDEGISQAAEKSEPSSFMDRMHLWTRMPTSVGRFLAARALFLWASNILWWEALFRLPLGDTLTINSILPVFNALIARAFFGWPMSWMTVLRCVMCVAGVVLIVKPWLLVGGHPSPSTRQHWLGALLVLLSVLVSAVRSTIDQNLRGKAHVLTTQHLCALAEALLFTPLAMVVWLLVRPDARGQLSHAVASLVMQQSSRAAGLSHSDGSVGWMFQPSLDLVKVLSIGLISHLGFVFLTTGSKKTSFVLSSTLGYLEVPIGFVLQAFVFHQSPDAWSISGAVLIVASSVANTWYAAFWISNPLLQALDRDQGGPHKRGPEPESSGPQLQSQIVPTRDPAKDSYRYSAVPCIDTVDAAEPANKADVEQPHSHDSAAASSDLPTGHQPWPKPGTGTGPYTGLI